MGCGFCHGGFHPRISGGYGNQHDLLAFLDLYRGDQRAVAGDRERFLQALRSQIAHALPPSPNVPEFSICRRAEIVSILKALS